MSRQKTRAGKPRESGYAHPRVGDKAEGKVGIVGRCRGGRLRVIVARLPNADRPVPQALGSLRAAGNDRAQSQASWPELFEKLQN
jgi:hypothetical protein